ncbi:MAG: HAD family hydrolase [Alphaproteobacteria bacterium]|nr:HAD family hydrolase [Alphaproteobacteria bacterium]
MTFRLIIFDCDGVLVDSESLANQVIARVFAESGFDISPEDCLRRFVGMSMRSVRAAVETESGRRLPDDFEPRVRALADEVFDRDLQPVRGVSEVLSVLPHARCVASSGSPMRIRRSLNTTGLEGFFTDATLFSAAMVKRGKPAPDLFLHVAETMACAPEQCLVIEDSLLGATAGVAAGMTVFGFAGASHITDGHAERLEALGVTTVFDDMSDLPNMLGAR